MNESVGCANPREHFFFRFPVNLRVILLDFLFGEV